jgi:uncharacterized damage-inducible protein DinB
MDVLDRFLGHDAATTRERLELARGLTDDQLDRPLEIDLGMLPATFEHVVEVIETWTDLMLSLPIRWQTLPRDATPSIDRLGQRFEVVARDFADLARRSQDEGRRDEMFVETRPGRRKSLGTGIAHVITPSMAQRTHVLTVLDRLGVGNLPAGEVLGRERRRRGGWEMVREERDFPLSHRWSRGGDGRSRTRLPHPHELPPSYTTRIPFSTLIRTGRQGAIVLSIK